MTEAYCAKVIACFATLLYTGYCFRRKRKGTTWKKTETVHSLLLNLPHNQTLYLTCSTNNIVKHTDIICFNKTFPAKLLCVFYIYVFSRNRRYKQWLYFKYFTWLPAAQMRAPRVTSHCNKLKFKCKVNDDLKFH